MMGHPAMKKANLRWIDSVLGGRNGSELRPGDSDLWPGDVGFVHPQQKSIDRLNATPKDIRRKSRSSRVTKNRNG